MIVVGGDVKSVALQRPLDYPLKLRYLTYKTRLYFFWGFGRVLNYTSVKPQIFKFYDISHF